MPAILLTLFSHFVEVTPTHSLMTLGQISFLVYTLPSFSQPCDSAEGTHGVRLDLISVFVPVIPLILHSGGTVLGHPWRYIGFIIQFICKCFWMSFQLDVAEGTHGARLDLKLTTY